VHRRSAASYNSRLHCVRNGRLWRRYCPSSGDRGHQDNHRCGNDLAHVVLRLQIWSGNSARRCQQDYLQAAFADVMTITVGRLSLPWNSCHLTDPCAAGAINSTTGRSGLLVSFSPITLFFERRRKRQLRRPNSCLFWYRQRSLIPPRSDGRCQGLVRVASDGAFLFDHGQRKKAPLWGGA
jgi:hypothetical protein